MTSLRQPYLAIPEAISPQLAAQKPPRAARIVLALLARLETGSLNVLLPNGKLMQFGREPQDGARDIHASLSIKDWAVFGNTLKRGDIGFAQDYIDGRWTTPSLVDLLNLMIQNRATLEQAVYGNVFGRLLDRLRHLLNHNSKEGSRKNIHAHYDLGNAFYTPWLDPSMTYSSALGLSELGVGADDISLKTLETAQQAKYQRVLNELDLARGQSVLEIGCGWGGFAELAVQQGVDLVGLTLSTEQLAWAKARLSKAQVKDAADGTAKFLLTDYRDVAGRPFDGIASIEMFEAVGEAYWPGYFSCIERNLKAGGKAVVQSIVINEALFERYRKGSDFIQQYIFPGGMLPSVRAFEKAAKAQGLRVIRKLAFGQDYALTLNIWRREFMKALPQIMQIQTGLKRFDDQFVRTWEFYLAYCEAAFTQGNTDVVQFTLDKP